MANELHNLLSAYIMMSLPHSIYWKRLLYTINRFTKKLRALYFFNFYSLKFRM